MNTLRVTIDNWDTQKIPIIKLYKTITNQGLKESKDYIEGLMDRRLTSFLVETALTKFEVEAEARRLFVHGCQVTLEGCYAAGEISVFSNGNTKIVLSKGPNNSLRVMVPTDKVGEFIQKFLNDTVKD